MAIEKLNEIGPGLYNQGQNYNDNVGRSNRNFTELAQNIGESASGMVRSVNTYPPDSQGNVTVPLPGGVVIQVITSSTTWTKPAGAVAIEVITIGGGGGGVSTTYGSTAAFANGGCGGGYNRWLGPASALPAAVPVTVGAGGAVGGDGGESAFGSFVAATGGRAGVVGGTNAGNYEGGRPKYSPGRLTIGGYQTECNMYAGSITETNSGFGGAGGGQAYADNGTPVAAGPGGFAPGGPGKGLGAPGGAAAMNSTSTAPVVAGNGSIPGGGGGSIVYRSATSATPGKGGRGEVIVVAYF